MAHTPNRGRQVGIAAAALLACCSTKALAQSAPPPVAPTQTTPNDAAPDDIVITAQRRSERLQNVPISVSAISGDALQKQRVSQLDDIATKVPNLQLIGTQGENTPIFSLRGVSMSDYSLNQSGPVATYFDEVYKGNVALLGVSLYDLERVEVLRGPQGTLYGRNTTGGAVNIISRRPELDRTSGYLNVGFGNYGRFETNGGLNFPLSDKLAARVAFTLAHANGWFQNKFPGGANLDGVREYGIRGSLFWQPTSGISFLLRATTSYQKPHNYGIFDNVGPDGVGGGLYEAFGSGNSYFRTGLTQREIESNYTPHKRIVSNALALTSNFDLGSGLSITSVTSWDKGKFDAGEDTDGSPRKTLEIFYGDRANQFAEDLRFTSNFGGRFEFILGGYFSREHIFNQTDVRYFNDLDTNGDGKVDTTDCLTLFPFACIVSNSFNQIKYSSAAYTDMHYDLSSKLTLRGGLRLTHDLGKQLGLSSEAYAADGALVTGLIPPTDLRFSTNNLSGKIGLDYKPSRDILIYGSYSRGYRAASFNAQTFFALDEATIAKPETIDAFEIGAKTQFLQNRLTLNVAAFRYGYRNQQFINVDAVAGTQALVNVDRSRILGGEAELNARVTASISIRASLGLLSTRIDKGNLSGVDLTGNKLANAPSLSLSGGVDATIVDSGFGKISIHPDLSYVSSQYFEVFNEPTLRQPGYALIGGHIDFERGPFTASIWAKNLANQFYYTSRIDLMAGFGYNYNHLGAPRTFGGALGFKF